MHTTNLRATRALLLARPHHYNQTFWMHDPRTPACIGGYALIACSDEPLRLLPNEHRTHLALRARHPVSGRWSTLDTVAQAVLGLDDLQARQMFRATPIAHDGRALHPVSVHHALDMLDHAIEHHAIRWRTHIA